MPHIRRGSAVRVAGRPERALGQCHGLISGTPDRERAGPSSSGPRAPRAERRPAGEDGSDAAGTQHSLRDPA
jgi:hypothetical protein